MRLSPAPVRSRTRGARTGTGPRPVMIARSGRWPWRTSRWRPSPVCLSAWPLRKAATSASTACANSARAPSRRTSVSGSENSAGWISLTTASWIMACHSFGGEVEVSNTPTIRRLIPSRRHQLPRIPLGYGAYRCIGSDGHRFDGKAVCANRPVRSDRLERVVWAHIEAVLNDPQRITHEYRRRLTDLASESQPNTDVGEVERRISTLRRGVGRLIDGSTDGVIERVEFEPRVADLRARIAQLEEHRDALAPASAAQRDLTLVIGRLEDFSIRVRENLDLLDWSARRDVIRLMVRRIEIDDSQVEIVFRIPPPPSGGTGGDRKLKAAQDCTGERRTDHRVAQPMPSAG